MEWYEVPEKIASALQMQTAAGGGGGGARPQPMRTQSGGGCMLDSGLRVCLKSQN